MSARIKGRIKERAFGNGEVWRTFYCPGCERRHTINQEWEFDGNYDAPTFSPSVLTYGSPWQTDIPRCHSFIRAGRIEFLSDSTHSLAGQTVDLPKIGDA
jgi:hypothetical protein